jgi:formaldehyde-activating enzyme involved in methanogenesis
LTIAHDDYEMAQGPRQAEVDALYKERLRRLSWGWSPHLAVLRDQLLIRVLRTWPTERRASYP